MTDDRAPDADRGALERRVDAALASDRTRVEGATGDLVVDPDDRWYGRLLLGSHASVAGATPPESTDPAAAAIELLREYARIRREQVLETDAGTDDASGDRTAVLLAGDVRHAAAYEALGRADNEHLEACFERLATVTETIAEGFAAGHERSTTARNRPALVDDTAGALGRGAAGIGATLAGATSPVRDRFETIGRGLATADAVGRGLAPDADAIGEGLPDGEHPRLREHGMRRLGEARRARDALPDGVDADRLQPLFDGVAETVRRTGDD